MLRQHNSCEPTQSTLLDDQNKLRTSTAVTVAPAVSNIRIQMAINCHNYYNYIGHQISWNTCRPPSLRPNLIRTTDRHASHSSNSWLERQKKDIYVKMSRYDSYRARSAYKLIQIDDKYQFLKPGKVVIEAGAAPGSWTQVICERLRLTDANKQLKNSGLCLALDLAAIQPVEGAICLGNADFTSPFTQSKILTWLDGRKADCVLSDMAPKATGHKYLNHESIVGLVRKLMPFTFQVLREGEESVFLTKLWEGEQRNALVLELREKFSRVKVIRPPATHGDSSELYIFARGFRPSAECH